MSWPASRRRRRVAAADSALDYWRWRRKKAEGGMGGKIKIEENYVVRPIGKGTACSHITESQGYASIECSAGACCSRFDPVDWNGGDTDSLASTRFRDVEPVERRRVRQWDVRGGGRVRDSGDIERRHELGAPLVGRHQC